MGADLGLLLFDQVPRSPQRSQQNQQPPPDLGMTPGSWMWNPNKDQEEDDSWEVRAFAEDTGNIMGTTWPPRSYTCTFCRREFKSAQALGGHMNVHRRDRARLHQAQSGSINLHSRANSSILIPTQELVSNGGLCLLYQLPNPNGPLTNPREMKEYLEPSSASTIFSISSHPQNKTSSYCPNSMNFPISPQDLKLFNCYQSVETSAFKGSLEGNETHGKEHAAKNEDVLDLELRLGHGPTM